MNKEIQLDIGFFGIFKESWKILASRKKIFAQITLSSILPIAFIYLAHIQIFELFFSDIMNNINQYVLYINPDLSPVSFSKIIAFIRFKFIFLVIFIALALLSTSAIVYTTASAYTCQEITFHRVITAVPKVWKCLAVVFLWYSIYLFAYTGFIVLVWIFLFVVVGWIPLLDVILYINLLGTYLMGVVYITMVWYVASMVSVLEDGMDGTASSMDKGQALVGIRTRWPLSSAVVLFGYCFLRIQLAFEVLVAVTDRKLDGVGDRIWFGIGCLVWMSVVMLVAPVVQTISYFACKSRYDECVDTSQLADHLGRYQFQTDDEEEEVEQVDQI